MGAFIERSSKGDRIGIWVSNGDRDAFLDWFAEHRCQPHDAEWNFCMSPGNRWSGCGLDLDKLLLSDQQPLELAEAELRDLSPDYQARFARMLQVLAQICTGEWKHHLGSEEAHSWWK
jgi:hypothetical protein